MRTNVVLGISIIAAIALVVGAFVFLRPKEEVTFPIKLVQYADYSCVYCKEFYPVWKQLQSEFSNSEEVQFEYIIHPILGSTSQQAAYAAAAADKQGKKAEYSDLLYSNFEARGDDDYIRFAQELGLNIAQFNADRESESIQAEVARVSEDARSQGITSTPTIVLNGRRVNNRSYEYLKTEINSKIDLAKQAELEIQNKS